MPEGNRAGEREEIVACDKLKLRFQWSIAYIGADIVNQAEQSACES